MSATETPESRRPTLELPPNLDPTQLTQLILELAKNGLGVGFAA
jgi:hypothetical protein